MEKKYVETICVWIFIDPSPLPRLILSPRKCRLKREPDWKHWKESKTSIVFLFFSDFIFFFWDLFFYVFYINFYYLFFPYILSLVSSESIIVFFYMYIKIIYSFILTINDSILSIILQIARSITFSFLHFWLVYSD